jgi:1,4-alpha-glucan branching enzyme
MISKTPAKSGNTIKVTFELPAEMVGDRAVVCGDFNEWSQDATPLKKRKDGRFSATVTLKQGQSYRFKYLIDGERWENDPKADASAPNDYGSEDSVLQT